VRLREWGIGERQTREDQVPELTNWAGNYSYSATRVHEPESLEQLREIVRNTPRLRVLGSRHSFNDIADTTGDLLSLRRMPRIFDLDAEAGTVTVDGGVRYGELCATLNSAGFALHNLASLPHISVAGACATGTHGSGDHSGNLATAVSALEVVTADGEVISLLAMALATTSTAQWFRSAALAWSRSSGSSSSRRSGCARTSTRTFHWPDSWVTSRRSPRVGTA
jgi:FAD/FMN-containing dehydrogenase